MACRPPRRTTAGPEALELAEICGLHADPWQADGVDDLLGEGVDGTWSAKDAVIICSRQNGKNVAVEIREMFGLVILGEWIIHTSQLFTTTKESYGRLLGWLEADREIADQITHKVASPASGYEMRFRSGGRIRFIARSRTSGRGLTGDLLVFDEAQDLDDDEQGALLPTTSARSIAEGRETSRQVIYTGSAPGPRSQVLHRWRKLGRAGGAPGLLYLEYSAAPDADLDDRDAWAQANPALGRRISEAAIESERQSMSPEMFARERLSISPDIDDAHDAIFAPGVWESICAVDLAQPSAGLVLAVDTNPERTRTAIAISGGGGTCALVDERDGTGWAIDELVRVARERNAPVAVAANGPAASMILPLEHAGVRVLPVAAKDVAVACSWFHDAVVASAQAAAANAPRALTVKRHPVLDAAVASAEKRGTGDVWVWNRRRGDVCSLFALTFATWKAQNAPAPQAPIVLMVRSK